MSGGGLFVIAVTQLVLTAAPGVAATLLGVKFGVRDIPVLLGIGLAGSGVAAMLTFWVYYTVPPAGGACAYAVLFGSIALMAWAWSDASEHRTLLRRLSVPLGLWALASLFILLFGYLHGGTEYPLIMPSYRFAMQPTLFTSDHFIPLVFSDWMFGGSHGPPPDFYGWLFSDRPPLQVGYVLTQRIFGWDATGAHYMALGVGLQQLWIIGMWALLTAARVSSRTRSLAIVAALVSDAAIVNGFFVWPKLLAASFVLAALALLVGPGESPLRRRPLTIMLLGALAGLTFLSHGTGVFGLIPVAAVALWRGLPDWRWLCAGATVALVLAIPWIAYQHFEDPPGDRLVKTFGILILALPLIAVGRLRGRWRDDHDWRFARICLLVFGVGVLAWGLLMFGNEAGRAIVITICLALPLLGIAGIVAGLRATYPRLAGWFVGANAITVLILYVPTVAPVPNNSYSGFAAVVAIASLAGFVKLAFSSAQA